MVSTTRLHLSADQRADVHVADVPTKATTAAYADGQGARMTPPENNVSAVERAYLMTGSWELDPEGKSPGIYVDDPAGGDPICLATIRRIHHKARLHAALGCIPAGYVMVPTEPTEAMIDRFVSRALCVSVHGDGGWSNYAREQWLAMIAAAPVAIGPLEGEGS